MKRIYHFLFVLVTLLALTSGALGAAPARAKPLYDSGDYVWAKGIGGTDLDSGYRIAVDTSGNVYSTGIFSGTVDFDPGAGTFNLTSAGGVDIFVSKLDANGNFLWAIGMGWIGDDSGINIAVDTSGNVYNIGIFEGTVDFDPGAGTSYLNSAGSGDIFVSKFDSNGNFIWAKGMGGAGLDFGNGIAVDASGNVYTTGHFKGTANFDPGAGTTNLNSAGGDDIFVSKLDANGNFIWAKRMGGIGDDYAYAILVDSNGDAYTTGFFKGTVDFDPGADTFNLTSSGNADIFVSKLDTSGNFVWAKGMGGTGGDIGVGIDLDASGNVYTTGHFSGTGYFNPEAVTTSLTSAGGLDIFVSKLDANGNFIWAKGMGGTGHDIGRGIAVDSSGNVHTMGSFESIADFDPGAGVTNLIAAGGTNIFVSKLDANGDFVWAKQMGGSGWDSGSGIDLDASGNVYTTGHFSGTAYFDPEAVTTSLTSAGGLDIFISKLQGGGSTVTFDGNGSNGGLPSPQTQTSSVAANLSANGFTRTGYTFSGWNTAADGFGTAYADGATYDFSTNITLYAQWSDSNAPAVTSITRASTNPTTASSVDFTVTFSEDVQNVDINDFTLTKTGGMIGESITSVSGSGSSYTVTVFTGSGNGTLRLDIPNTATIQDLNSNALSGLPITSGETYDVEKGATFSDVPTNHWAWQYVERLYNSGITGGCGGGNYCPDNQVTRAQMAVFLLRGIYGSSYTPSAATGTVFNDVGAGDFAAAWIEQMVSEDITSGCGGGNYCPSATVTRTQMAVFLLRAKHGSDYTPPAATGTVFNDVGAGDFAAAWIEQLVSEGVTTGCGGGNYCPNQAVTRAQMAVFLVRIFNLP